MLNLNGQRTIVNCSLRLIFNFIGHAMVFVKTSSLSFSSSSLVKFQYKFLGKRPYLGTMLRIPRNLFLCTTIIHQHCHIKARNPLGVDCINTWLFTLRLVGRQVLYPTNCCTKKCITVHTTRCVSNVAQPDRPLVCVVWWRVRKWWNERGFCRIWPRSVPKWPPTERMYLAFIRFLFPPLGLLILASTRRPVSSRCPSHIHHHQVAAMPCTDWAANSVLLETRAE